MQLWLLTFQMTGMSPARIFPPSKGVSIRTIFNILGDNLGSLNGVDAQAPHQRAEAGGSTDLPGVCRRHAAPLYIDDG